MEPFISTGDDANDPSEDNLDDDELELVGDGIVFWGMIVFVGVSDAKLLLLLESNKLSSSVLP